MRKKAAKLPIFSTFLSIHYDVQEFYNSQILDKKKKASSKELIAEKLRDSKNL